MAVDLPAPLGPSRARISPGRTVRSTPSRARTAPWRLWTPRRLIAAVSAVSVVPGAVVSGAVVSRAGRSSAAGWPGAVVVVIMTSTVPCGRARSQALPSPLTRDSRHGRWRGYSGAVLIRQVRPLDMVSGQVPARPVDLRIRDGVITEIAAARRGGGEPSLSRLGGEEVLDGAGAIAIPGLWDQHVHAGQLAQAHARLDTSGAGSVGVILELVRAELAARREDRTDPGRALVGFGHRLLDLAVPPTVPALDAVTGAVPTVLIGGDAHHAWVNSAALGMLGLPPRDGLVTEDEWFDLVPHLTTLPGVAAAFATGAAMMQRLALVRCVFGIVDMEWVRPCQIWRERQARLRVRTAVYPAQLDNAPGPSGMPLDETGLV